MQAKLYWQQIVALASYDANFQVEYFQWGVLFKTSNLPGNGIFKFCLWTIRCFLKQSFKTILSGKINMSKKWTGFHGKEMPNMTTSTGTSILGASILSGKVFSRRVFSGQVFSGAAVGDDNSPSKWVIIGWKGGGASRTWPYFNAHFDPSSRLHSGKIAKHHRYHFKGRSAFLLHAIFVCEDGFQCSLALCLTME